MKSEVTAQLQQMGFTEYEAKAYIALLEQSPATGYAVAQRSGVPRSKIYAVLGNLANRGDILVSHHETPQYTPRAPKELVAGRKKSAAHLFDAAERSLKQYAGAGEQREIIWNIVGREAILDQARKSIAKARIRIVLEIWREDAEELRHALRQAAMRRVHIHIVAYGAVDFDFAEVRHHDIGEEITGEYGARWIVMSVDDGEVVAGTVSMGDDSRAALTVHPGLVMPITEVVIHDLYIMDILDAFRPQLEKRFGPNLSDLRRKYTLDGGKRYLSSASEACHSVLKNKKTTMRGKKKNSQR